MSTFDNAHGRESDSGPLALKAIFFIFATRPQRSLIVSSTFCMSFMTKYKSISISHRSTHASSKDTQLVAFLVRLQIVRTGATRATNSRSIYMQLLREIVAYLTKPLCVQMVGTGLRKTQSLVNHINHRNEGRRLHLQLVKVLNLNHLRQAAFVIFLSVKASGNHITNYTRHAGMKLGSNPHSFPNFRQDVTCPPWSGDALPKIRIQF